MQQQPQAQLLIIDDNAFDSFSTYSSEGSLQEPSHNNNVIENIYEDVV